MNPNTNIDSSINDINNKVIEHITELLHKKHISQQKFAELSGISQSTISKLLNGDANFSLNQLIRISEVLQDNIFNIISSRDFNKPDITSTNYLLELNETDNIILNTDRPAFKGYLNTKYHTYFISTVSGMSDIVTGEISFTATSTKRCQVDFTLCTGKKDLSGNDIKKNYMGSMFISIPLSTCYCILKNEELGEISYITFHHMFILNENMRCRSCAVLTTSSGENRRPTMHRMIMSDYKFDINNESDCTFLMAQLRMNNKKILIRSENFKNVIEKEPYKNIDIIGMYNINLQFPILDIDENLILGSSLDSNIKIGLINDLRAISLADTKNKISTNTDEFLYSHIQKATSK